MSRMKSAKQKMLIREAYNLGYTDLDASYLALRSINIEAPLNGWVSKIKIGLAYETILDNGTPSAAWVLVWPWNVTSGLMSHMLDLADANEDVYTGLHENILAAVSGNEVEAYAAFRAPKPFYLHEQSADIFFYREIDVHKKVASGDMIQIDVSAMPEDNSGTYTSGAISIEIIVEFIVGAMPSYGHNVRTEKQDFDHMEYLIYGQIAADESNKWIAPSAGRISNVRSTLWNTIGDVSDFVTFGLNEPLQDIALRSQAGSIYEFRDEYQGYNVNYNNALDFPGLSYDRIVLTNHQTWVQHLRRDQNMILRGPNGANTRIFTIEFDWIGDYNAPSTRMITYQEGTGTDTDRFWHFEEPLYVLGMEVDVVVKYDDDEDGLVKIDFLANKDLPWQEEPKSWDPGMGTEPSTVWTTNTDSFINQPSNVVGRINIPIEGSNDSAGAQTEYVAYSDKIPVGRHMPVGSNLEFNVYTESLSDFDLEITVLMYVKNAYKSKDWGRNVLDGILVVRQEVYHKAGMWGGVGA